MPNPSARPQPKAYCLTTTPARELDDGLMTIREILVDVDSPYHITRWGHATLYPVDSRQDLWLLVYGSYAHPMAKLYTQLHWAIQRGLGLEAWRKYAKRPIKPMSKFVSYDDCVSYSLHYFRSGGKARDITLAQHIGEGITHLTPHSGADFNSPPATSAFDDTPLAGVVNFDVTRAFAQRWARGGYVYPDCDGDTITLDVIKCKLWQAMTYNERALLLTHREHSMLSAYYAIPQARRQELNDAAIQHADAPCYG